MWNPVKYWKFFIFVLVLLCCNSDINCDQSNPLIFTTKDCFLTEPVYGHKFDFNSLRSDFAHTAISDKGDTFKYNICGNLTQTCDGHKDVAACLKRGDKEYVLGTQHQLNYRNGKMFFNFSNGASCPSGGNYQLHVFVGCDYILDKNQSEVTGYSDNACSFYITLETPQACLPEPDAVKSNTCSVKDPKTGYTYNLMPLSDGNYRITDRADSIFVLNVCKPILYGELAMCPAYSGVCLVSLKTEDYKKKFFNYGTVQPNPVYENDQLLMRMPSTTPCNSTHNYTSVIYFNCDKSVRNAQPVYMGNHGCTYIFSFLTHLACSSVAPCTLVTHRDEILDLRPLQDKAITLSHQDKNYTFSVCSNAGTPCLEEDGSCFSTISRQSTSLGKANSHLLFNHTGTPYLLYKNGAPCQKSNTGDDSATTAFWSTKIEFVCANNATKDNGSGTTSTTTTNSNIDAMTMVPKIIENSNCQVLIHYQTELACQEQITCKAKWYVDHPIGSSTGEELVDLTPLISATENYEATIDSSSIKETEVGKSTKFYLNVCRPLVSKFGLGCPAGSAACMAKVVTATPEDEVSLGYPVVSVNAINRTTVELRYLQGGICPTDNSSQISSGIEFNCDMRAGRGNPVLKSISDCHYQFTWATNVICPPHTCIFDAESCSITNDEIKESYSLRKAPYTDAGKLTINGTGSNFTIDICDKNRKALTDFPQGLVNLFFSAKGPCGEDGNVNVQMRLICSSVADQKATSQLLASECNLIYTQRTPDICKFLGLKVPSSGGFDETATTTTNKAITTVATDTPPAGNGGGSEHPAEHTGSIGAILAFILSVTFFSACLGVLAFSPARRNTLRRCFRRSRTAVRYSRVQTNEEANLLLEPNGHFTDSDDDMLL